MADSRARALATFAEWAFTEEVSKYVEVACVGASIGGDFTDTRELHVMTYKEVVLGPDRPYWRLISSPKIFQVKCLRNT